MATANKREHLEGRKEKKKKGKENQHVFKQKKNSLRAMAKEKSQNNRSSFPAQCASFWMAPFQNSDRRLIECFMHACSMPTLFFGLNVTSSPPSIVQWIE